VGIVEALQPDDVIVSNHRSHGHLLAKGADPGPLMAEIMGKAAGVNKGKSGTLHMAVPEVNALMTSTIVGAGPPLAVGAAFAQQYRGKPEITVVFFGDGAAAEPLSSGDTILNYGQVDHEEIALMSWHAQREWLFPPSHIT
jgi:TPP-dependent pyruvate/acetoin dehydrogenase alpha subunit